MLRTQLWTVLHLQLLRQLQHQHQHLCLHRHQRLRHRLRLLFPVDIMGSHLVRRVKHLTVLATEVSFVELPVNFQMLSAHQTFQLAHMAVVRSATPSIISAR
jgi:hypothetical protein